jgi:hypothetical protein
MATTDSTITVSCDDCCLQGSDACDDCLVSFVLGRDPDDAVVIDAAEARTVRMMATVGLVPSLRFRSRERALGGRAAG